MLKPIIITIAIIASMTCTLAKDAKGFYDYEGCPKLRKNRASIARALTRGPAPSRPLYSCATRYLATISEFEINNGGIWIKNSDLRKRMKPSEAAKGNAYDDLKKCISFHNKHKGKDSPESKGYEFIIAIIERDFSTIHEYFPRWWEFWKDEKNNLFKEEFYNIGFLILPLTISLNDMELTQFFSEKPVVRSLDHLSKVALTKIHVPKIFGGDGRASAAYACGGPTFGDDFLYNLVLISILNNSQEMLKFLEGNQFYYRRYSYPHPLFAAIQMKNPEMVRYAREHFDWPEFKIGRKTIYSPKIEREEGYTPIEYTQLLLKEANGGLSMREDQKELLKELEASESETFKESAEKLVRQYTFPKLSPKEIENLKQIEIMLKNQP